MFTKHVFINLLFQKVNKYALISTSNKSKIYLNERIFLRIRVKNFNVLLYYHCYMLVVAIYKTSN